MPKTHQICLLLVEDDLIDVLAFKREIAEMDLPYDYVIAASLAEAQDLAAVIVFDIAILDYSLGDGTSETLLPILADKGIPAIITTVSGDEERAVRVVCKGAYDYLIKDSDLHYLKVLPATIDKALKHQRTLQQTQLLLHAVSHASDAIFIVDLSGKLLFVNQLFCRLSGLAVCAPGGTMEELGQPLLAQETFNFINTSDSVETKQTEIELTEINGKPVYLSLSFNLASNPFSAGKIVIAVARDISDYQEIKLKLQEANQKLEMLSNLDGLTQIANYRYFHTRLGEEWFRSIREGQPLSLIMLDVDRLKYYNDHYGHTSGDDCLIKVAQALQQVVCRSSDLVARFAGEEFAILLPNTTLQGAIAVAEKIQETVRLMAIPHENSDIKNIVTVSMGVASILPTIAFEPDILIAHADKELLSAKEQGRDRHSATDLLPM